MLNLKKFHTGQTLEKEALIQELENLHYRRQDFVSRPGDFSDRGNVVDIYPLTYQTPVRLTFHLDEIESIHDFSLETGESITVFAEVTVLPLSDMFQRKLPAYEKTLREIQPVESFFDIKAGDFVVHLDYGVGCFMGFKRLKINTVVQRGVNDHTVLDLLAYFRGSGHSVRLIEYMDVGNSNHWHLDQVVTSAEWVQRIGENWPIEPVHDGRPSETARRYRYLDGQGEIGLISSISQPFCGGCTRARLTADGMLYTCLFGTKGFNLMPLLRQSSDPIMLRDRIRAVWLKRDDRYSEIRSELSPPREKVEMYRMGG